MKTFTRVALSTMVCLVMTGGAIAQAPTAAPAAPTTAAPVVSAVTQHYRAYRAAIAKGDLPTAETEASAALDASVARDGDGGNTGPLALNLAQARLSLGRTADAYEPALRASTIASAPNAKVDPLLARLVLGRAQLTDARASQGTKALQNAIDAAKSRPDLDAETYNAAADLGHWFVTHEQYSAALEAWEVAMQKADAAGAGNEYARAEARMEHAAALFTRAMQATDAAQHRPEDTRIGAQTTADKAFDQADLDLVEVQNLIGPSAFVSAPDGGVTLGQRVYANAIAWRNLVRSFAEARGLRNLPPRSSSFIIPRPDGRPACNTTLIAKPEPQFPTAANVGFTVGAVVVRLTVDEAGRVTDTKIVAAIPDRGFRDVVERVAPQWRLERLPDSAPDCRYDPIQFIPIRFRFT